jgi:hypothetical protein
VAAGADVPDLILPTRAPKTAPTKPTVAQAKPPAPAVIHGAIDDPGARNFEVDDSDYGDGAKLDLDLSHGPPMISDQVPSAGKIPAAAPAGASGRDSVPQQRTSGSVPSAMDRRSAADGGVDAYEARALSDYGDPPSQWWRAPLYAYRVLRLRPDLKKRAAQKRREADRAQGAAEDALMTYGELVRPEAEKLAAFGPAFSAVRATEAVVRERDAVLAAEADAHKSRQAQHAARVAELEAQLSQIQIEEKQIAGEFAEADALTKCAEARAKRAEIEMRNAIDQAGGPPEGRP